MNKLSLAIINFIIVIFLSHIAQSVVKVDINQGITEPLPIAITDFISSSESELELSKNIVRVVQADLLNTGLFKIINKTAYLEKINDYNKVPNFTAWRQINANALLSAKLNIHNNKVTMEFKLWDPYAEQLLIGKLYRDFDNIKAWRRVAHQIADEIYKTMTAEEGYFDTKIVYIAESGSAQHRIKRLAIMDQDGENRQFLSTPSNLNLTPRFSPNGRKLLYLSFPNKYERRSPRVYIKDLFGNSHEKILGDFPGMTFAPRFSPDSSKVVMSVANNGNTDIYSLDLKNMQQIRLTKDPAIDVSPCYSADGKQIVFTSDRGGSEQLYIMNADGSNSKRISFGTGSYSTPVWSPRADYIAFTKKVKGSGFYIGVIKPDGSGERILTQGYLVEGPTWSPNGRVIIYTKAKAGRGSRAGVSRLYSIDLTGRNEREIITPTDASDPAWSSTLKNIE